MCIDLTDFRLEIDGRLSVFEVEITTRALEAFAFALGPIQTRAVRTALHECSSQPMQVQTFHFWLAAGRCLLNVWFGENSEITNFGMYENLYFLILHRLSETPK